MNGKKYYTIDCSRRGRERKSVAAVVDGFFVVQTKGEKMAEATEGGEPFSSALLLLIPGYRAACLFLSPIQKEQGGRGRCSLLLLLLFGFWRDASQENFLISGPRKMGGGGRGAEMGRAWGRERGRRKRRRRNEQGERRAERIERSGEKLVCSFHRFVRTRKYTQTRRRKKGRWHFGL